MDSIVRHRDFRGHGPGECGHEGGNRAEQSGKDNPGSKHSQGCRKTRAGNQENEDEVERRRHDRHGDDCDHPLREHRLVGPPRPLRLWHIGKRFRWDGPATAHLLSMEGAPDENGDREPDHAGENQDRDREGDGFVVHQRARHRREDEQDCREREKGRTEDCEKTDPQHSIRLTNQRGLSVGWLACFTVALQAVVATIGSTPNHPPCPSTGEREMASRALPHHEPKLIERSISLMRRPAHGARPIGSVWGPGTPIPSPRERQLARWNSPSTLFPRPL